MKEIIEYFFDRFCVDIYVIKKKISRFWNKKIDYKLFHQIFSIKEKNRIKKNTREK